MKTYYSLIRDDGYGEENGVIDDYVIDTGLGVLQIDAQSGERLHTYSSLEDYLESYPDCLLTEVDYEG